MTDEELKKQINKDLINYAVDDLNFDDFKNDMQKLGILLASCFIEEVLLKKYDINLKQIDEVDPNQTEMKI